MAATKFQTATLRPLDGVLDMRSSVDETPPGSFRYKLNFAINPDSKLSRALGWTRAFPSVCYGNSDWHSQGVADASREPPTLLFSSISNSGVRRLFMGTKTRLFVYDPLASFGDGKGDWTPLTGGPFGSDGSDSLTQTRFHAAELQNKVVFTNNLDLVQIHTLGTTTVAPIPSLALAGEAGFIGVTAAKVVVQFAGIVFILNTVEGSKRFPSRIRWSDLNDADWWLQTDNHGVASAGSISDFQDLDYGEIILNAIPIGGALYVFTDRSIWRCTPDVGATMTLTCVRVYTEPKNRAKCLAYPNSLVSTGFSAFYLGADGIYEWNQYMSEPDRVEWLHRSTTVIFKDLATRIDKEACNSPIAEYVPGVNEDATAGDGEVTFSWPIYDPPAELVPDPSPDCETYTPFDRVEDDGINSFSLVANIRHKTADIRDFGVTAMVNHTPDISGSGGCNQQSHFIAASSADYTLKKMDTGYGREFYDAASGEWSMRGYYSIARGVFPFDKFDAEKIINRFLVESNALDPAEIAVMRLRLGTSFAALDPNIVSTEANRCVVIWHRLSNKPLKCLNTYTADGYEKKNLRPNNPTEWFFLYRGKLLYYELAIANPDNSAPTSGGTTLSRIEVDARLA